MSYETVWDFKRNDGTQPVGNVIEVEYRTKVGPEVFKARAMDIDWGCSNLPQDVESWRLPHRLTKNAEMNKPMEAPTKDAGAHYRYEYKGVRLDPFRIAKVYELDAVQLTILKKTLVNGDRGHKDAIQDYEDIICAANRAIEMIDEDNVAGLPSLPEFLRRQAD